MASYDGHVLAFKHYSEQTPAMFNQLLKDFGIDEHTLITMEATGVYHLQLAHAFDEIANDQSPSCFG